MPARGACNGHRRNPGSEARIDGLALQGQHAEDALVDPAQRLAADETLQRLDPQRELAQGQRPLGPTAEVALEPSTERLRYFPCCA